MLQMNILIPDPSDTLAARVKALLAQLEVDRHDHEPEDSRTLEQAPDPDVFYEGAD